MATAEMDLRVSAAPYLRRSLTVTKMMSLTLLALLFPSAAAIYYYGTRALLLIVTCMVTAIITEYVSKKIRNLPFVVDGSSLVIGLLLALTLPPTFNLWMAVVGTIFGVGVVKEAFGGLGNNTFSPALAARAALALSFSEEMTTFIQPMGFATEMVIANTPLSEPHALSWALTDRLPLYRDLFLGNVAGSIGETSILLILIGATILLAFKLIDWRIPAIFIGTVAVVSIALGQDPIVQLLAGALMLGAFFIATDSVTSPLTHNGRIIFAIGCGLTSIVIRRFGPQVEGVYYAILFMNAVTPIIDRYVKVRPLGVWKGVKSEAA